MDKVDDDYVFECETFVGPKLERAVDFLQTGRAANGWPAYPGLPVDQATTRTCVEVMLELGGLKRRQLVSDVVESIAQHVARNLDMDEQELVPLAHTFALARRTEAATMLPIVHDRFFRDGNVHKPISTPTLSQLISLFSSAGEMRLASPYVDLLVRRQGPTRGWGPMEGHPADLASTAWGVVGLFSLERTAAARTEPLEKALQELSSKALAPQLEINTHQNVHLLSLVISALAARPDDYASQIQEAVALLYRWRNADGLWGAGPQEQSSYAATATASAAMVRAGEAAWAPGRAARMIVNHLRGELRRVSTTVQTLESHLMEEVERTSGAIMRERDDLRRQLDSSIVQAQKNSVEVTHLRHRVRELENSRDEFLDQFRRVTSVSGVASRAMSIPVVFDRRIKWSIAALLVTAILISFGFGFFQGERAAVASLLAPLAFWLAGSIALVREVQRRVKGRQESISEQTEMRLSALKGLQLIARFGPDALPRKFDRKSQEGFVEYYAGEIARHLHEYPKDVSEAMVYNLRKLPPHALSHSEIYLQELFQDLTPGVEPNEVLAAMLLRLLKELDAPLRHAVIQALAVSFLGGINLDTE